MNEKEKPTPESLLDAFLDGQVDQQQRLMVEKAIETDAELADSVALQNRIDQSLQERFAPSAAPKFDFAAIKAAAETDAAVETSADVDDPVLDSDLPDSTSAAELPGRLDNQPKPKSTKNVGMVIAAALAAAVAWVIFGVQLFQPAGPTEVAFRRQPLVDVYQKCVAEGFQPYWVCDNEKLFAATFEKRQGLPLKLAPMPASVQMVGLSYLGGVSRQSTSMLAKVDGQQVIVFVDRVENDIKIESGDSSVANLNVFKTQRNGLVFYEVSPLNEAKAVEYLVRIDN